MKTSSFAFVVIALGLAAIPVQAQSVDALELEKRSSYRSPSERIPFWPIGWAPAGEVALTPVIQTEEIDTSFFTPDKFSLTSISIGRLPLALINGRTYSEGDPIPVGAGHSGEVVAVRDGEAVLRFRDKTISVPLKTQGPRQRGGAPGQGR